MVECSTAPTEAGASSVPPEQRAFCIACIHPYEEGDQILVLPCGHSIHDGCKPSFTHEGCKPVIPAACYWSSCLQSDGTERVLRTSDFIRELYSSTSSPVRSKPIPPFPSDGHPGLPEVDGRDNPVLESAKASGKARNIGVDTEMLPNFSAKELGVPTVIPRTQIRGPIRHRLSRIHPIPRAFASTTRMGYECNPDFPLDSLAPGSADVARFSNLPSAKKGDLWCDFIAQRNWWGVPISKGINRRYARDITDCAWIERTSDSITTGRELDASFFASQDQMSRHFHSFNTTLSYMYEGLYRHGKGLWISHHDVMWDLLSPEELGTNFPKVSQAIIDLKFPIGLAIPTPPTPFYYGVTMAKLQRDDPTGEKLKQFENSTMQEYMILAMARYCAEMKFGGRLFCFTKESIAQMRATLAGIEINLPIPAETIFGIMSSVHEHPERLLCSVDFTLPEWAQKAGVKLEKTCFLWALKPSPAINKNALHGRCITQELDGTIKSDRLAAMRPIMPKHTPSMRAVIKEEEIDGNPRLAAFVRKEFNGTIPLLPLSEVLERLSYRACEALARDGKISSIEPRSIA